jgi:autotransporter-associated beta strand protein
MRHYVRLSCKVGQRGSWSSVVLMAIALILIARGISSASDDVLGWDPGQTPATPSGGTGTWDSTTATWSNGSADVSWGIAGGDAATASFAGTAGTVTLGESLAARGLAFAVPGYTLTGAGPLAVGSGGFDASGLANGTTSITTDLTAAAGQAWRVGSGSTLALTSGTFTRAAGSTVGIVGGGTVTSTMIGLNANTNGIVGPWAVIGAGADRRYAAFTGSTLVPYTGGTAVASFGWPSGNNNTFNYDVAGVTGAIGLNRRANTVRYTGAAATQTYGNNSSSTTLTLNGLMNVGSGQLTLRKGGSGSRTGIWAGTDREVVLVAETFPIRLENGLGVYDSSDGASSVVIGGASRVEFGAVAGYTGPTYLNGGHLALGNNAGVSGQVVFAGGRLSSWSTADRTLSAALLFAGDGTFGDADAARSGRMTITGDVDLGGAARTITTDRDTTFAGTVSNGGLTKTGAARLSLSGANTYEGPTQILAGGMAFTTRNSLYNGDPSKWTSANLVTGAGVTVVLGVGGTSGFTGSDLDTLLGVLDRDASTGSLKAGGSLGFDVAEGAEVSVSAAVEDTTGDGGGAIGFIKSGPGLLTLDGASTYSGGTVVEGGGLLFGSTAALPPSGGFTVQQGAAIGGGYATLADWLGGGRLATTSAGAILLTANDATAASFADYPGMSVGGVGNATYSGSLTPGGDAYRLGGGAGNLTVASVLTGESGLVVVGPGTVTLTGANDFTGGTSLTGGRLALGSAGAVGSEGMITFSGGATLVSSAANTSDYSSRFSTANNQAIRIDTAGQSVSFATPLVSSGGTLTKLGAGTLTLAAANSYSGDTRVIEGTLRLADASALAGSVLDLADGDAGSIAFQSGVIGPFRLGGIEGVRSLDAAGIPLVVGNNASTTYSGAVTAGSLTKAGTGTLTLTGSAALSGSIGTELGTLRLDFASAALPDNIVSPTSGLQLGGGTLLVAAGEGQFNTQSFASTTVAANASTVSGNSGTGFNLDIALGTLTRSTGATLNIALPVAGTVTAAVGNTNGIVGPWATVGGNTWAVAFGDPSFPGPVLGLDEFAYQPVNIFGGSDTSNSLTSLTETLLAPLTTWSLKMAVTEAAQVFDLGGQTLTVSSGGLLITAPNTSNAGTIAGQAGQVGLTAGDGTAPAELIVHQYNTNGAGVTISAGIGDNGSAAVSLTKAGSGRLTLSGANSFSGPVRVLAGRLGAAADAAVASAASIDVSAGSGAQFRLEGDGMNLSQPLTIQGGGIVGEGTLQAAVAGGSATYSGPITVTGATQSGGHFGSSLTGSLVLAGPITHTASLPQDRWVSSRAGTVVLASAASDYAEFRLAEGTLRLGVANAIPTGGSLRVGDLGNNNASATFDLAGFDQTLVGVVNNLTGSNATSRITSSTGPATLTLEPAAGATSTYSGQVTGSLALVKQGAGTFGLTGANDYLGSTTVTAGTFALGATATLAGTPLVSLASGTSFDVSARTEGYTVPVAQTLAGSGTVVGSLTIGSGGTLAPGSSPGTLSVTETVTWASGGNYNWQIASASGTAGVNWDLLTIGGPLVIGSTAAEPFRLNLWSLSGTDPDVSGDLPGFNPAQASSWTIASAAGGITDFAADAFLISTDPANGTDGFTNNLAGGSFSVAVSGNDLNLVFSPGSSPSDIVIDVSTGSQTQAAAGYPTIATATSVTKVGAGTVVFDAANAYTGPTTVSAGTLQVANPDALAATPVTVDTGATLAIASGTTMRSPSVIVDGGTLSAGSLAVNASTGIEALAINAGTITGSPAVVITSGGQMSLVQDARVTVAIGSLSVDQAGGGGRLDMGAGRVTIAAGGISAADLRADLIAGRNGGAWNGASGIMSSTAATSGGTRAVGYVVGSDGTATLSFAAPGDVDLSGQVNVFDLVSINSSGTYGTGSASVWSQGDFNYDGVTNVFDLVGINTAAVYGQGGYFPAVPSASGLGSVAAVPEPASLSLVGLLVLAATARLSRCGISRVGRSDNANWES